MKRLFKRVMGKNQITNSNIDAHLRILVSQTRELIRREMKILEASENYATRCMRIGEGNEVDQAVTKYIICNRRLDAFEALMRDIETLRSQAYEMASSSVPPLSCEGPLKDVLVVASTLKIEAFMNFRRAILEKLYTKERCDTLGLRRNMNETIERGLFCTDVTDDEFNEAVRAIAWNNEVSDELSSKALKKAPVLSYPKVLMPEVAAKVTPATLEGVPAMPVIPSAPVTRTSTRHSTSTRISARLAPDLGQKYVQTEHLFSPMNVLPVPREEWEGLMLEVVEATSYD